MSRSLVKCCHQSSQNIQIVGVTGMAENKGIFWSVVHLGAAVLERDLSTSGLVEHEMHPTVWQPAELAVGTAVSSPKHTLLKCAQKYRTMSSLIVQERPNPAFLRSAWPWSHFISLCYATVIFLASLLVNHNNH